MSYCRWLVWLTNDFTAEQRGQKAVAADLQVRLRRGIRLAQAECAKPLVNQPLCLSILLGAKDRLGVIALAKVQAVMAMKPGFREGRPGMSSRRILAGIRLHLDAEPRVRVEGKGEKQKGDGGWKAQSEMGKWDRGATDCPLCPPFSLAEVWAAATIAGPRVRHGVRQRPLIPAPTDDEYGCENSKRNGVNLC